MLTTTPSARHKPQPSVPGNSEALAVFVPSLVLAWLAVRSVRDQQFLLERQQLLLYQGNADSVAAEASGIIAERQREFARQVEALLADNKPIDLADAFDERLRKH